MRINIYSPHPPRSSIGKYAFHLCKNLNNIDGNVVDLTGPLTPLNVVFKASGRVSRHARHVMDYLLARASPRLDSDLCHIVDPSSSTAAWFRRPRVITVHDVYDIYGCSYSEMENAKFGERLSLKLRLRRYKEVENFDAVICVSDFTRKELEYNLKISGPKVRTIHLGVDHSVYGPRLHASFAARFGLPRNKKILLNVGVDIRRKNLRALILAMKKLDDDFILVRVGRHSAETNDIIKENGLGSSLATIRNLSENDLAEAYCNATAVVVPSTYEGFGLPALEAMACGCPVIVGNAGASPEIVGNGGLLWDFAVDTLTSLVYEMDDKKTREDLGSRAIDRAKSFSWERMAKETSQVYHEVQRP